MSSDDRVDPTALEQASFSLVRRGFDPAAVQTSLRSAAAEIRRLQRLRDELQGRLIEQEASVENDEVPVEVACGMSSQMALYGTEPTIPDMFVGEVDLMVQKTGLTKLR